MKLGVRAEAVRRAWPVIPVVVVVPDEISYIRAIGSWTIKGRFPVLIEDGSPGSFEDIARFVRGFKPERVVRWSAVESGTPGASAWPEDGEQRRELIESTMRRVWKDLSPGSALATNRDLIPLWIKGGITPPGIIVADESDPAWTAALALAVGHAEPLVWLKAQQGVNGAMPLEQFGVMAGTVESACDQLGLTWRDEGDDIDAITLCLNLPVKVQLDPGNTVATTDLLGRLPEQGTPSPAHPREHGKRWAWAGQIFGTEAQAAYRAMCALFIHPRAAWIFDGYPDTKPWNVFDGTAAGKVFEKAGMPVTVEDSPRQSERQWRLTTGAGLDAGVVLVNTKGMAEDFELEPGKCRSGDVPFLNVPAMVHFVHSWSAAMPAERGTVAGRWMERGAYAYLGSVQEPMLQAFVPTPQVAARLMMPCAWGAAVRLVDSPAWKLAVIGDPLITVGPAPAKAEIPFPLGAAADIEEQARGEVGARAFASAIRDFVLLGHDQDAAKLAGALLREDAKEVTPEVAEISIMPLARTHNLTGLVKAYSMLPANLASQGALRDALWQACYAPMPGTDDQTMLTVLRTNMRMDQIGRDAAELSGSTARLFGRDTAVSMLEGAKAKSVNESDKARIDEALKRLDMSR